MNQPTKTEESKEQWADPLTVMMILYDKGLVDARLLVYHKTHTALPIAVRNLPDGFPQLPFACNCGKDITEGSDLEYEFAFIPHPPANTNEESMK